MVETTKTSRQIGLPLEFNRPPTTAHSGTDDQQGGINRELEDVAQTSDVREMEKESFSADMIHDVNLRVQVPTRAAG